MLYIAKRGGTYSYSEGTNYNYVGATYKRSQYMNWGWGYSNGWYSTGSSLTPNDYNFYKNRENLYISPK